MSIGIYKIINPKNKIYIGQSVNIESRWYSYRHLYKSHMGIKLYNSLKKYGPDNHEFIVIEECKIEDLNSRELFWSNYYKSLNEGLNSVIGGEGYGVMSEEQKKKIGKSNSKPKPKNFNKNLSRIVLQFNMKGVLINEYKSYCEAVRVNGFKMHEALKGRAKTTKGYIWKYKDEWDGNNITIKPHGNKK